MRLENDSISNEVKELCAITTMRDAVNSLAKREKISFEDAMFQVADSAVYETLFDYDTEVWKEGPVYLLELYDDLSESDYMS